MAAVRPAARTTKSQLNLKAGKVVKKAYIGRWFNVQHLKLAVNTSSPHLTDAARTRGRRTLTVNADLLAVGVGFSGETTDPETQDTPHLHWMQVCSWMGALTRRMLSCQRSNCRWQWSSSTASSLPSESSRQGCVAVQSSESCPGQFVSWAVCFWRISSLSLSGKIAQCWSYFRVSKSTASDFIPGNDGWTHGSVQSSAFEGLGTMHWMQWYFRPNPAARALESN